jgi:hypothetical protein
MPTLFLAGLVGACWIAVPAALVVLVVRRLAGHRAFAPRRGPKPARPGLWGRALDALAFVLTWRAAHARRPPLVVGRVRLPHRLEPYHLLVTGSPGSGKSSLIESFLHTLRRRGERALVFDVGGESWAAFSAPDDRLLDPFDARSVSWSPFAEMTEARDAARLARALIPSGHGEGQEWHHYAQRLFAAVLEILWRRGERTNGRLLDVLLRASDADLRGLLAGTGAARFFAPGAERMAASVRAILGSYLPALEALDPSARAHDFGCGSWVRTGSGGLFLALRENAVALQRPLVSAWIDLVIASVLSERPDPGRRLWLVLDEFDSLGTIPSLLDGLTKGRKHGLCVVAGLQSVAQLERRYGREGARVLLACFATKVVLRSSDIETAEYASRQLGERECTVVETSRGRGGRTRTRRLHRERLVLAGEITSLPDRRGWLQLPGPVRLSHVRIPKPRARRNTVPSFVPRPSPASLPEEAGRPTPSHPFFPAEDPTACSA